MPKRGVETSAEKRAALLVTRNFPPLLGGMERVNQELFEALRPSWQPMLCGPAGCGAFAPDAVVAESAIRPLPLFLVKTLRSALAITWRRRPEIVIAGSGLTAPIAWLTARLYGARAVVYLHGLDIVAPSLVYQWAWLPLIRRMDLVLANSAHTAGLAAAHGVTASRIRILNPGTTIPALDQARSDAFREQHGLGAGPLLLSVGRLTRRKGLATFVEQVMPQVLYAHPSAQLIVVGEDARQALHSPGGSERARIEKAALRVGIQERIRFLGHCTNDELTACYLSCDVHVFPVIEDAGDVEGFGMVALEAAAHGLPSVAFSVGGVPDAIGHGVSGVLVSPGDYAGFAAAVLGQLGQGVSGRPSADSCRAFAVGKAWPIFGQYLRACLGEAVL